MLSSADDNKNATIETFKFQLMLIELCFVLSSDTIYIIEHFLDGLQFRCKSEQISAIIALGIKGQGVEHSEY